MARWRIDLRPAIGSTPLGLVFGRDREYKALPRTSLWFIDNHTIAVSFITRDQNTKLSTRDASSPNSALRLNVILVEANTGRIIAKDNWPAQSRYAAVVAAYDGKFITQTGNDLTLFGPDFKPLKKTSLPLLKEADWVPRASPSGKSLLFLPPGHQVGSWLWVDATTLETTHSWKDVWNGEVTIADEHVAMLTCTWWHNCEPRIDVRGLTTEWKTVAPGDLHSHLQFVNEETLFSWKPARLIKTNGKILSIDDFMPAGWCWWGPPAFPSAEARRFIVPICRAEGGIAALDIGAHVVLSEVLIYELTNQTASHKLQLGGPKLKDFTVLAVSPDGSRLAVLNGETVQVFELPPVP